MNTLEKRNRLFALIRDNSFSMGGARELASGRTSNFYFDMKPTMFHPDAVNLIAELICDRLESTEVDYIGGLEMGAVPLLTPVISEAKVRNRYIPGFFVRKKPKEHGTKKQLEGVEDLSGKHVVIIDDVTTSGKSSMDAVRVAREAGAIVTLVMAIVDRCEGAVEFYNSQNIPFASLFNAHDFMPDAASVATSQSNVETQGIPSQG